MKQSLRLKIIGKLHKILIVLNTPGAWNARRAGCYLTVYELLSRIRRMGIVPSTLIDIGANRGMFSRTAHYVFPEAEIFAFEPLKDCYDELARLQQITSKVHPFMVAVGATAERARMNRSEYDYSSSILEMAPLHKEAFPYSAQSATETVDVRALDELLVGELLERPILLKIDVQGYEGFVIQGAQDVLRRTDYVVCELSFCSLYRGQALFEELYHQLRALGFRFAGHLSEVRHPKTTEVLQIDGLFVRELQQ